MRPIDQSVASAGSADFATPAFAWFILACLGAIDLVRGFLHTFLVNHSAQEIAGMNLDQSAGNQLMLLGAFGISNFLTGAIYLAVALKARQLVPAVLAIIPLAYLLGFIGLRINQVQPEAAFPGRYFMLGYAIVCVATLVACLVWRKPRPDNAA